MLIFYSGSGRWTAKNNNGTKQFFENDVTGYFILTERNSTLKLKYNQNAKVKTLYPCYDHEDGAILKNCGKESNVYFEPYHTKTINGKSSLRRWVEIQPSHIVCENYKNNEFLPILQAKQSKKINKAVQKEKAILNALEELEYNLLSIPEGGKSEARIKCLKDKNLFRTMKVFDNAWERLRQARPPKVEMKDQKKYNP